MLLDTPRSVIETRFDRIQRQTSEIANTVDNGRLSRCPFYLWEKKVWIDYLTGKTRLCKTKETLLPFDFALFLPLFFRFPWHSRLFTDYLRPTSGCGHRSRGTGFDEGNTKVKERCQEVEKRASKIELRWKWRDEREWGPREEANTRIFIYANGIRIQLIVRPHTRSDSRDGYSGIVSACQFA